MAGTQTGQAGRGDEPSALEILVDGLIERAGRSPLMRRAPAQCTPDEQAALVSLLADLQALRAMRASLERLPALRLEQVQAHWPELAALLAAARRPGGGRPRPRDGQAAGAAAGALFDTLPLEGESHAGDPEPTSEPAPAEGAGSAPDVVPGEPSAAERADLAHHLLEALTVQGKALNTTQMLSWLQERGIAASREDVTNSLYRHEELFRRRGTSHWVVAGQEAG